MNMATLIEVLQTELREDEGYRISWVSNIAMCFYDNWRWACDKSIIGKLIYKLVPLSFVYRVANDAAEYFISNNLGAGELVHPATKNLKGDVI